MITSLGGDNERESGREVQQVHSLSVGHPSGCFNLTTFLLLEFFLLQYP